jgi:hypothetical protein
MVFIEIFVWLAAALIALGWVHGVRSYLESGRPVQQQTINIIMLFCVSLVAAPILGSSFHLLWMFPAAMLLGFLSLSFPFSLLTPAGHYFGLLCSIGLDHDNVKRRRAAFEEGAEFAWETYAFTVRERTAATLPSLLAWTLVKARPGWAVSQDGVLTFEGQKLDYWIDEKRAMVRLTIRNDTTPADVGLTLLTTEFAKAHSDDADRDALLRAAIEGYQDYYRTIVPTLIEEQDLGF